MTAYFGHERIDFLPAVLFHSCISFYCQEQPTVNSEVIKIFTPPPAPLLLAQIELSLKQIWPQHFGWWQLLSFPKLSHTDTHKLISTMFSPFTPPRGSVTQMSTSVTRPWWCHWLFTLTAVGWFCQTHLWAWAPSGGTVPARLEGECKPR